MQFAVPKRGLMILAVAAVAAGSLSLVGCNLVSDSLTGSSLLTNQAQRCIKDCQDEYRFQVSRELKRHLEARKGCYDLSGDAREACLSAEQTRHEANEDQIEAAQRDCINACHRQGGSQHGDHD